MLVEELLAFSRQNDDAGFLLSKDDIVTLDQTVIGERLERGLPRVSGGIVAQVVGGHDPKRADGRQRPALIPVEPVLPAPKLDRLSLLATGQVHMARRHVEMPGPAVLLEDHRHGGLGSRLR